MLLALVAVVALAAVCRRTKSKSAAAPDFAAKTTDGKDVALKGALKDAKAVVVCSPATTARWRWRTKIGSSTSPSVRRQGR